MATCQIQPAIRKNGMPQAMYLACQLTAVA
jgi:hypothetical protein